MKQLNRDGVGFGRKLFGGLLLGRDDDVVFAARQSDLFPREKFVKDLTHGFIDGGDGDFSGERVGQGRIVGEVNPLFAGNLFEDVGSILVGGLNRNDPVQNSVTLLLPR